MFKENAPIVLGWRLLIVFMVFPVLFIYISLIILTVVWVTEVTGPGEKPQVVPRPEEIYRPNTSLCGIMGKLTINHKISGKLKPAFRNLLHHCVWHLILEGSSVQTIQKLIIFVTFGGKQELESINLTEARRRQRHAEGCLTAGRSGNTGATSKNISQEVTNESSNRQGPSANQAFIF